VPVGLAVGERDGVGFGVALGVPVATGVGNGAPALIIGVLVGTTTGVGVLTMAVGFVVGMGVAVGSCVVVVGVGGGVGVGSVGVGVAVGGTRVMVSVGNDVISEVAVSNTPAIAVACVAVCVPTIPVTENNNNAKLMARARKTQYAILVDFLFTFIKPRIVNTNSKRISALSAQYAQIVHF